MHHDLSGRVLSLVRPMSHREAATASVPRPYDDSDLERMATVGALALGMGHELRNLIMPLLLRLDVLALSREGETVSAADLASIRDGVVGIQQLAASLRWLGADPTESAGGRVSVATTEEGTTYTVCVPHVEVRPDVTSRQGRRVHLVVSDPRQRTVLRLLLAQRGLDEWQAGEERAADVIVCDGETVASLSGRGEVRAQGAPRIIALGSSPHDDASPDVCWARREDLTRLSALLADA